MKAALVVPAASPRTPAIAASLRAIGWEVTESDGTDVDSEVRAIEQRAELSMLVVVAPPIETMDFESLTAERWDAILHEHLGRARDATRASLPPMVERGSGNVVFVTSTVAQIGDEAAAASAAAQGAVHGFMRALAREFAPAGVSINALAPDPDTSSHEVATIITDLLVPAHFFVGQVLGANNGSVL